MYKIISNENQSLAFSVDTIHKNSWIRGRYAILFTTFVFRIFL